MCQLVKKDGAALRMDCSTAGSEELRQNEVVATLNPIYGLFCSISSSNLT